MTTLLLQPWLERALGAEAAAAAALECPPARARFERGDAPALFCYTDDAGRLRMVGTMPQRFTRLLYLLCEPDGRVGSIGPAAPITIGQLDGGKALLQLQQLLLGLHLPHLRASKSAWLDRMQQDWVAQADGFCSALSEAVQPGRAVLHVPHEQGLGDAGAAARDRELVQRLEVQLLRWTHQIRGLLTRHSAREEGHEEGPLDEVRFWRCRTADLGSLRDQLQGGGLVAVLRVLEAARSPHLPAFLDLRGSIAAEAAQAASNLAFLTALEAPCARLTAAGADQLAAALPPVLDACGMVWTLAPYYRSPEQISGLLRRVGSWVVALCRSRLALTGRFGGMEVEGLEARLEQCCAVAAAWRRHCEEAAARVAAALPDRPWAFDAATLFAHVDASVRRCRDLQECCAAQRQFLCRGRLVPVLSGPKAPEIERAIGEVQLAFEQQMGRLRSLPYDILDVQCTAWYEDVAAFRAAMRTLEQLLGGVLATATAQASCLAGKLDVIEAFALVATRDGLKKAVQLRLAEWHLHYQGELAAVRQCFDGVKAELPPGPPLAQHAGRAVLLSGLLRRIQHTQDHLAATAAYLPQVPAAAISQAAYEALHTGLQQHVNALNVQWFSRVPADIGRHLQSNLLQPDRAGSRLLHVSLSAQLEAALEEGLLFEQQRMGVPLAVAELGAERQRLRAVHVGATAVCRAYNSVLGSLSADERRLCKDRIRFLDRHVLPGVHKLSWASPHHQTAFFQKDALRCCKEVAVAVAELQAAGAAVAATCTLFQEALLVRVERKRLYSLPDFEQRQTAHQAATSTRMQDAHSHLVACLSALYCRFAADGEEVQLEWLAFLRRADERLLEGLAACVRRSLHELARVLQGGHRGADGPPVFVLSVILDTNGRVELQPTMQELFDTVQGVCKAAVAVVEGLPRLLPAVLRGCAAAAPLPACLREVAEPPPFAEMVGQSEEAAKRPMQAVTAGVSSVVERVQQLLASHEGKYMVALWQTASAAYMRRYERANKPVAAFMADTQKYLDLKEQVLAEDSASNVRWLRLDCTALKQQLATLCDGWVSAFTSLLASMAARQLASLQEELQRHVAQLTGQAPPATSEPPAATEAALAAIAAPAQVPALEHEGGEEGLHEASQAGAQERGEAAEAREEGGAVAGQSAAERLEALHCRLEGEREELRQRLIECQDKYDAMMTMQASLGVPDEELEGVDGLPALWAAFEAAMQGVPSRLRELWDS